MAQTMIRAVLVLAIVFQIAGCSIWPWGSTYENPCQLICQPVNKPSQFALTVHFRITCNPISVVNISLPTGKDRWA